MIAAMALSMGGSLRARLAWVGAMGYMLYNYAFYLFGAAFNVLFLLYVTLLALSIYGLIFALTRADAHDIALRFRDSTPVRAIGGFMLAFAALLGGMWIARSLSFVATGQVPPDILQTGHPTGVVYAVDLTLLVPALVLSGAWLWQRRPWGYVFAAAVLVKASTYGLALILMSPFAARAGVASAWDLVPLWAVLEAGCVAATVVLFRNMQP
jgi:hypothetical protein